MAPEAYEAIEGGQKRVLRSPRAAFGIIKADFYIPYAKRQRPGVGPSGGLSRMSHSIRAPRKARVRGTSRQPFAIVGYIPFLGARGKVGSLLLAFKDEDGAFRFAGTVRKGFTGAMRVQLGELLEKDHVQASPVIDAPLLGSLERWAIPRHVADVEFAEWAPQGQIRTPSFKGLCDDKRPSECVREDIAQEHAREDNEGRPVAAADVATVA